MSGGVTIILQELCLCLNPVGPRNANLTDHKSQVLKGHPLYGLHVPAGLGGATEECRTAMHPLSVAR